MFPHKNDRLFPIIPLDREVFSLKQEMKESNGIASNNLPGAEIQPEKKGDGKRLQSLDTFRGLVAVFEIKQEIDIHL